MTHYEIGVSAGRFVRASIAIIPSDGVTQWSSSQTISQNQQAGGSDDDGNGGPGTNPDQ